MSDMQEMVVPIIYQIVQKKEKRKKEEGSLQEMVYSFHHVDLLFYERQLV